MKKALLIITFLQPIPMHAITVADLNNYYARVVRGINCYRSGKECKQEDKKAVWQVGGVIGALLVMLAYTQRARLAHIVSTISRRPGVRDEVELKRKFLKEEEERQKRFRIWLASQPQEVQGEHPMVDAIDNADTEQVKNLAKDPANLNITSYEDSVLVYAMKKAMKKNDDKPRMEIIKILLDNGADKYTPDITKKYLDAMSKTALESTQPVINPQVQLKKQKWQKIKELLNK